MTSRDKIKAVVGGLKSHLAKKGFNCPVIMANQARAAPPYPYLSYTITTPIVSDNGSYSVEDDTGVRYKNLKQIWSFTVQSDKEAQTAEIALCAYDWFSISGTTHLNDNGVIVSEVRNIYNRDNLISIEYEYRQGFDVTFSLLNTVSEDDAIPEEDIQTYEFTYETEE